MAEHRVALNWKSGETPFARNHAIAFKQGAEQILLSSSPGYGGDPAKADPEDLLVAAMASCHMLSFLAIAARKKLAVLSYEDDAVGFLENDGGRLWITHAILRPKVVFETDPGAETLAHIHHLAHEGCFIANSLKTDIKVEPR